MMQMEPLDVLATFELYISDLERERSLYLSSEREKRRRYERRCRDNFKVLQKERKKKGRKTIL